MRNNVIKFRRILCDVHQSKLSLKLREPHGGHFWPERRNENADAVERKNEDESGGCSGRVERSASCCIMYHVGRRWVFVSRWGHQMWRYRYVFPNTRAHAQLYVLTTLISSVATLVCPGRLLAATLKTRHTLTHFSSSHFSRNCCLCLLKPQCPGDKQSQPRGWSSVRCPPQTYIFTLAA